MGKVSGDATTQAQEPSVTPGGWDQVCEYPGGVYPVDQDPRVEWKTLQEEMLRSYLATAESDLKAKQELVDIKQQRLHLAQHDLNHLNTTLSTLSTSTTSRKFNSSKASLYIYKLKFLQRIYLANITIKLYHSVTCW